MVICCAFKKKIIGFLWFLNVCKPYFVNMQMFKKWFYLTVLKPVLQICAVHLVCLLLRNSFLHKAWHSCDRAWQTSTLFSFMCHSDVWDKCRGSDLAVSSSCLIVSNALNVLFLFLLFLQYGAEFRRFSVDRVKPGKFEEFYKLILHIHRIANMEVMIGYADVHGDLLPINNDDNFCKAVSTAHPLLRIFIQRQGRLSDMYSGHHTVAYLFTYKRDSSLKNLGV